MASHQPTDDELSSALRALRGAQPEAGIPKIHAALQEGHPDWVVSLKRTRKVLQTLGLVLGPAATALVPSYKLNEKLDVGKFSAKVQVKDFGMPRGKGLVAAEDVKAGEVLWKEDPFVLAPEPDILDSVHRGVLCAHCLTQLSATNLVQACAARGSCTARFCNRLCLQRAQATHPLLCSTQNPAGWEAMQKSKNKRWQAAYALLVVAAKMSLLGSAQERTEAWAVWEALAFAQPGTELWKQIMRPTEEDIARALKLQNAAFDNPKVPKLLKNAPALDEKTHEELFGDEGFRRGLSKVNLNLEINGGLYALHSHLNHSCVPSVAARHIDHRTALARLSVVALKDLKEGEELTITYIDPKLSLEDRRRELRAWGIRECRCERCVEEEKNAPSKDTLDIGADLNGSSNEAVNGHSGAAPPAEEEKKEGLEDLEKEIKEHLGL
ncbi:SET domain-containing protein [Exidia glandulosa HHB12029]|uniref:Histone-lysine N-methyltransferase SET5 n=1 Tax=Exidia glandulosa HHB12029 TaxID=1314781 RepID=A0A165QBH0_EXIGL|nr:SET domain-containing protein [Exidia glandulosa HHB12029]